MGTERQDMGYELKPKGFFDFFTHIPYLISVLYILGCAVSSWAGTSETSASFLLTNLNARSTGMGGLFSATAYGSEAIYTNPAGLSLTDNPEVNFSYVSGQDNSNYGFAGYVHPLGPFAFGTGITYYTAGNIDINYADGTTQAFNAERSYAGALSIGAKYDFIALGISPKFIRSTLVEQFTGSAYAVDAGVMLFPAPKLLRERLILGASVQNFGSKISYKNAKFNLPETTSAGFAGRIVDHPDYGSLLLSAQLEKTIWEAVHYRTGGEWKWSDAEGTTLFFLRGGYRINFDTEDYSVGIGVQEKNVSIDYAFTNGTELENQHLVTLMFRFGEIKKREEVDLDLMELQKSMEKEEKMELVDPAERDRPIPPKEFKVKDDVYEPKLIKKEMKPEEDQYQLIPEDQSESEISGE